MKKSSLSFDSPTAFNCSEGLDQIGTISKKLMPIEKIVTDSSSETLFSITLDDTVYSEHVHDGEELQSDRKLMCSTQSFLRAQAGTASYCDKQADLRGQTPVLGSAFSLRHLTKCLSAGFKLPLDSRQMPSRFLGEVFREQTVFTSTSRRKATVHKLSSHLIWKQTK